MESDPEQPKKSLLLILKLKLKSHEISPYYNGELEKIGLRITYDDISRWGYGDNEFLTTLFELEKDGFLKHIYTGTRDGLIELKPEEYAGYSYKKIPTYYEKIVLSNEFNKLYKNYIGESNFKEQKEISTSDQKILLPPNTRWSDINIKWINGNDVEITLKNDKNYKETFDYKELGFYDYKKKGPNIHWKILINLSKYNNEMSWEALENPNNLKQKDAFQQRKSLLSRHLQKMFNIKEDPFETIADEKKYKIKINLIPEKYSPLKETDSWEDMLTEKELEDYNKISKEDYASNLYDDNED